MWKKVTLFITIILFAFALGLCPPKQWLPAVFHHSAYYFILCSFVLWVALILELLHKVFFSRLKRNYPAMLLAVILMALIFHISPPEFKILADETNLISASMAMHRNKTVSLPLQGLAVEYYAFDYSQAPGQRPLLYPFAVSLVHAVAGYSPYNGMVVNFIAGAGILFLFYLLPSLMFSRFFGFAGMIVAASFPIFIFWTTSSGFEILNLFLILFVLTVLYLFLKERNVKYAELLVISLVLLANCRYESALFIAGLIFIAPLLLSRTLIAEYRIAFFFAPLLLVPLIWQRRLSFINEFVREGEVLKKADQMFGLSNFADNFSQNFFVMTGTNVDYGFLPLVFAAAVAGIYVIARTFLQKPHAASSADRLFALYTFSTGILLFTLYTSFYWGRFATDIDNRLALAMLPFLLLPAIYFAYLILQNKSRNLNLIFLFLLVIQLLYYWPAGAQQQILKNNSLSYMHQRVSDYLYANYDIENKKVLLISDRPNIFVIHGIGSVGFGYAEKHQRRIALLENIYYDHILVLQKCDPATEAVYKDNLLSDQFWLQKVGRINVSPSYYLQISEAKCQKN